MQERAVRANAIFTEEDDRLDQLLNAASYNRKNLYNFFGFKPVLVERKHEPVEIVGELPADLIGVYLRNGANPQFDPSFSRRHMFDGPGMLHQIQITKQGASYSNTFVRTPRFEFEQMAGREVFPSMGEMVSAGPLFIEKMKLVEEKRKKGIVPSLELDGVYSATAVQPCAGRIFCLNESGYPFGVNAKRDKGRLVLDGTGAFETWDGRLTSAFSAHPVIDPETEDFYSLTLGRHSGNVDACHVSKGELVQNCSVSSFDPARGRMAWLHECLLTRNFIVFPDISMRLDQKALLGPDGSMFAFDPNYKMRWGVLPRSFGPGTEARWFETDRPGAIWHLINAWEQESPSGQSEIVIYAPRFESYPPDMPIHTPAEGHAYLNKWVLNLDSGGVSEDRKLLDWGYERTSFNTAYRGRRNRYAYLLDEQRAGYMGKGVLKYDLLEEKEVGYFDYGEFFGGEALFVPRAGGVDEDDGYLLDLLMTDNKAELIVIDARSLQALAHLKLPGRVPFGVHACWMDERVVSALRT